MEKPAVILVDNDMAYCDSLVDQLSNDYTCHVAHSPTQARQLLTEITPKVLLMDKSLYAESGEPLFKTFASNDNKHPFAVFVISADDSVESRIDAFQHGASEYMIKPFNVQELSVRMAKTVNFVNERQSLEQDANELRSLVSTSMQQASQYGYVMNFFRLLNECNTTEQVAQLFFEAMAFFDLKASLMTLLPDLRYWDQQLADLSPIEKNIFELLSTKGRLYEFRNRMIVNDKHVSFIIKNMPSDAEKAGQVRDFTAALIEGMESKLQDLQLQAGVLSAADSLNQNVEVIKTAIYEHNRTISSVMSDMLTDISASYHELEMTEAQETFFSEIVERGVGKLAEADNHLYELQTSLESLLHDMETIKKEAIKQETETKPVTNNDVELF